VMIYFDKPTQYNILKKFVPLLREDGLLFAGHSESFLHATDLFRSLGRTTYALSAGPSQGQRGQQDGAAQRRTPVTPFPGKGDGGKADA